MKLNVLFSPVNADELSFANKTTVVIDVLRASSTIINALSNGAKEVIPVATVEFAVKVSGGMFGGQTLLGGERNTKKIEGFALGNSPLEYSKDVVEVVEEVEPSAREEARPGARRVAPVERRLENRLEAGLGCGRQGLRHEHGEGIWRRFESREQGFVRLARELGMERSDRLQVARQRAQLRR